MIALPPSYRPVHLRRFGGLLAALCLGCAALPMAMASAPKSAPSDPSAAKSRPAKPKVIFPPLSPFSQTLAARPRGGNIKVKEPKDAWAAIANSTPQTRQSARWELAQSVLAQRNGAAALAVLTTMELAEPELSHIPAFRMAMARANQLLGRQKEARNWLNSPELLHDSDACALHILAFTPLDGAEGDRIAKCAVAAVNARKGTARAEILLAAAEGLLAAGKPKRALIFLNPIPEHWQSASLLRGQALIAVGDADQGVPLLHRVYRGGNEGQRAKAEFLIVQDLVNRRKIKPETALKRLRALAFRWRDGKVERAALELAAKLAEDNGDHATALEASATLFRYFDNGPDSKLMLERIHRQLALVIEDPKLSIGRASGLFWDYRDLSPGGGQGDAMVYRLADRLAQRGLMVRAAELLQHQLMHRADDIAKGPLSLRIARLLLRANRNEQVLAMLRASDGPNYSPEIAQARIRMEAIATFRAGRPLDAVAMIDPDQPGGALLRAEMLWVARDWEKFAVVNQALVRPGNAHAVLRQAIALMMLRDEYSLAALRQSQLAALHDRKAAAALEALASPDGAAEPGVIDAAMARVATPVANDDLLLLTSS